MTGSARECLMKGIFVALSLLGAMIGLGAMITTSASASMETTPRLKPPAPGPEYLSRSDHGLLLLIADALKKKQFSLARGNIHNIQDPIARSLAEWMYFRAEDPLVDLKYADEFLDAHGDWPAARRIQNFVEDRIPLKAPSDDILAFFESRTPVSGDGRIRLAKALLSQGDVDAAEAQIKEAWINHNFSSKEEKRILATYGNRLTKEDHAARVDRLLWARQVTNARRVFSRLDKVEKRKAQARAALLMRAESGPRLYQKLPREDQLDSGVLHAAVRYYRRSGNEIMAVALASEAPQEPGLLRNGARWWDERQLLMRWALKEGRFGDAYTLAANHGLEEGGDLAEAEFNAGWIALRFLNDSARAEMHFLALASAVGTPISLSRANYWLGRTAAARNNKAEANKYYKEASQYYYSFYGQLAAEELGGAALQSKFGPLAISTPTDRALFTSRPTVAALRMLSDLNLDYEFMVFAYHVDDQLERPGEYIELAKITNGEGAPHLTVRAGKVAIQRKAFTADVAYPAVFVPEEAKRFVAPEIILGLSRQESEFNPRAFSRAGARGMMQLIPSTALITARKEGLRYSRTALLDDPVYNMTIGSAHLSHLIDRFDGSLALTFAAYNAGASRADQWIERYGDPRSANVDPVDWIELVPFAETRNYIQRVLENTQVYRGRLNDQPIPGYLSQDVERAGPKGRIGALSVPSAVLAQKAAGFTPQIIAPVPTRTIERAAAYRLAQMAPPPEPEQTSAPIVQQETSKPTSRRQRSRSARAKAKRIKARRRGEPAQTETQAPPVEANTAIDKITVPSAAEEAEAQIEIEIPVNEPTSPTPIALTDEPVITDTSAQAKKIEDILAPLSPELENDDTVLINEVASSPDAEFIGNSINTETQDGDMTPEVVTEWMMEECLTYSEYLSSDEEDEPAAADLNAQMLAEVQGNSTEVGAYNSETRASSCE
ncbi:MAG: hypothetical protein DHS20C05_23320 [Hyphococcus sp.]|nr:MAG: hypothetical protein DHS20C05_23320 [Marinicaulis sp.]